MAALTWTALFFFCLPSLAFPIHNFHQFHVCTNESAVNLLKNPSFEDGSEGWTMDGGDVEEGYAADGSYYLALPRLQEKVLWQAKQDITGLKTRKEHTASVSFRGALDPNSDLTSASCLISILIRNSNSSTFVSTREQEITKTPTDWESLSGTFVPPFAYGTLELTATCLRLRPGNWRQKPAVEIHLDDAKLEVSPRKVCEGLRAYKDPRIKARRAVVIGDASETLQSDPEGFAIPKTKKPNLEPEVAEAAAAGYNSDKTASRPPSDNPTKVFSDPNSHPPVQEPKPTTTKSASSKTVHCHGNFGGRRKYEGGYGGSGECECGCGCCPCECCCPKQ